MTKRLYKSTENRVLFGLLGGIGEYFNADPVLVRVLYLMISVFTGVIPGIIAYVLGAIVVPTRHSAMNAPGQVHDTEAV